MTTTPKQPSAPSQQRTPQPREIEPRRLLKPGGRGGGRPPLYTDRAPKRPVTLPAWPYNWKSDDNK
jgi:hypothetical protein